MLIAVWHTLIPLNQQGISQAPVPSQSDCLHNLLPAYISPETKIRGPVTTSDTTV